MFNGSSLRVCRILWFVKKIRFCILESGRTKPWCPGLVSRPSAKGQEPVARIRGLVIQPPKHNRNHLYSRAIHSPASMEKDYVQWFILKSVQDIMVCEKIRFLLLESGRTKPWCPGLVSRPSAKGQEPVARIRGPVILPPKLSVGAYFELSYLGYGFKIHLSNRSDSPRFRAPWKKIRQKYDIQQEPSLFKGHPLSYLYGDALCSMVPT